jgi:hypothetical protein
MEETKQPNDVINWESIEEVKNIEDVLKENPEMACMMSRKHSPM